ncbi:MAG: NAD(P)-dependent oxidoreductase, partial [Lachnospiraceae bacterium]|nr:NAD(P)-dependent oxidoreductase [Lachnospiraceae bacterium]
FVIPRLSRVYGPGLLDTDTKAVSQFLHKAAAGEDIVLKSKGDQLYSYTYSVDCARAILFLMLKGEATHAYNVSDDGSVLTLAKLAELLAQLAGTKVVFELPDALEQSGYSKTTKGILSAKKLTEAGFVFHTHIREGLEKTLDYLKNRGEYR